MTNCVEFPQSRCLLGVASGNVTPPVGIYHRMWGAAQQDQSNGIHRELRQTTLVMAPVDSDEVVRDCVVFIGIDHCLLGVIELRRILARITTASGVAMGQIAVFFSHTHGAGLLADDRVDLPGGDLIPDYFDFLENHLAESVTEALNSVRPAAFVYGTGHCTLATNRDYFDAAGNALCGFNPDGAADTTVVVARAHVESDGRVLASVVNYACHPTTLAWDNTLISPDYVGAMRQLVEDALGGAPCLFLQGASGDIGPRHGFVKDTAIADQNGRQLGYAVLSVLESLPQPGQAFKHSGSVVSGATIGTWDYTPVDPQRQQESGRWGTCRSTCSLAYRADLPQRSVLEAEQVRWEEALQHAQKESDATTAAEARAMLERIKRRFFLIQNLPEGSEHPYPIRVWRLGDAVWVALNGEPYNTLQTQLRDRFPQHVVIAGTLANGSTAWYLPDSNSYGKGLYQEQASVLAQGSLETLIESLCETIHSLTAG